MRLRWRIVAVVVIACVGLSGGSANAADLFSQAVPGAVAPASAPSITELDGVKVKMSTAVSTKSVGDLKAHYRGVFEQMGLYLDDEVNDIALKDTDQITALDTERLISWTVLLKPSKQGAVTVLLTSSELSRKPGPTAPPFAPLMPNAVDLVQSNLETMDAFTYAVPATPLEIKDFYRAHFKKAGFKEEGDLIFTKGNEQIALTVSPGVATRGVMLVRQTAPRK